MSETITPSCGCVFCDLNLRPVRATDGRLVHGVLGRGVVECKAPANDNPDDEQLAGSLGAAPGG